MLLLQSPAIKLCIINAANKSASYLIFTKEHTRLQAARVRIAGLASFPGEIAVDRITTTCLTDEVCNNMRVTSNANISATSLRQFTVTSRFGKIRGRANQTLRLTSGDDSEFAKKFFQLNFNMGRNDTIMRLNIALFPLPSPLNPARRAYAVLHPSPSSRSLLNRRQVFVLNPRQVSVHTRALRTNQS